MENKYLFILLSAMLFPKTTITILDDDSYPEKIIDDVCGIMPDYIKNDLHMVKKRLYSCDFEFKNGSVIKIWCKEQE